jgi:hypothetical protein
LTYCCFCLPRFSSSYFLLFNLPAPPPPPPPPLHVLPSAQHVPSLLFASLLSSCVHFQRLRIDGVLHLGFQKTAQTHQVPRPFSIALTVSPLAVPCISFPDLFSYPNLSLPSLSFLLPDLTFPWLINYPHLNTFALNPLVSPVAT